MNRDDKTVMIDVLTHEFGQTDTLFIADYRGLDVPAISALRDELRPLDAEFRVVKNTLARKAAQNAGWDDVADLFAGPTAVTFVKGDAAAAAKILDRVGRTGNVLQIRGGVMDKRRLSDQDVKDIATLPTREVILAMFLSAVNAPLTQLVGTLAAPMRDIVGILDAYIEKREAEEGTAA